MSFVTVDFETFYDKQFSLSKLTTEEYIRDPRFEVIGVGMKIDNDPTMWFSGTHTEIKAWLNQVDWANSALLCHNTQFDGAILSWVFDIHPKVYLDTLCMARAIHGVDAGGSLKALAEQYQLGAKGDEVINALGKTRVDFSTEDLDRYGRYCVNDVDLTHALFNRLIGGFPRQELKVIDITLKMFIEPTLELNLPLLESHLESVKEKKAKLLAAAAADRETLMSNDKFAELLKALGVDPPRKVSARTGKEAWAFAKTDEEFKALLEHKDPRVQTLVGARLGVKTTLEETRTQRFIDIALRGKLPVPIKYYGAHTGRWAGCLVDDTEVVVYHPSTGVVQKQIVDVLADDLVWDGEEFVPHEGVKFSGFAEVITWDGITGTEDHAVYTDAGQVSLREAMQGNHAIQVARSPEARDVEAARQYLRNYKTEDSL